LNKAPLNYFHGNFPSGPLESDIMHTIFDSLVTEKNNDTQTQCVKCLSSLIPRVSDASLRETADILVALMVSGRQDLREVYKIGLKTLIKEIPEHNGALMVAALLPLLRKGVMAGPGGHGLPLDDKPACIKATLKRIEREKPTMSGAMLEASSAAARAEATSTEGGDVRESCLDCMQDEFETFGGHAGEGETKGLPANLLDLLHGPGCIHAAHHRHLLILRLHLLLPRCRKPGKVHCLLPRHVHTGEEEGLHHPGCPVCVPGG
jgi:hypothetical protein